jgi:AraC-like DNA-binding protein
MFALAYNGLETFTWSSGLSQTFIFFDLFPFVVVFTIGPSFYLYTSSLLSPERKRISRQVFFHFALPLTFFVLRTLVLGFHILWINKIIATEIVPGQVHYWYASLAEPLSVLFFLLYLFKSLRLILRAKTEKLVPRLTEERRMVFQWLSRLMFCMIILGVAWPLTVLAPIFFELDYDIYYYPIEIALVFFIYWIAFAGYYRTRTIYVSDSKTSTQISDAEAQECLSVLRELMENHKVYLQPDLNLSVMSTYSKKSAKAISAALNQHHGKSFNEFVNEFRVREVQQRLLGPQSKHLTISGIALESGFNSQATFQRAFKNITGMSPREYMVLRLKNVG